ncbi:MAG: hypothetical protein IKQ49_11445 [Eubacterium sp.]|nr:hypothetical protein [Eubacterium sp.]
MLKELYGEICIPEAVYEEIRTEPACQSKWHKSQKGYWYGDASGWYAKSNSCTIDGTVYSFDQKGYCTNP